MSSCFFCQSYSEDREFSTEDFISALKLIIKCISSNEKNAEQQNKIRIQKLENENEKLLKEIEDLKEKFEENEEKKKENFLDFFKAPEAKPTKTEDDRIIIPDSYAIASSLPSPIITDLEELEETIFDEFKENNLMTKKTPHINKKINREISFDPDETRLPDEFEIEEILESDVESPSLLPNKQKKWKKTSLKRKAGNKETDDVAGAKRKTVESDARKLSTHETDDDSEDSDVALCRSWAEMFDKTDGVLDKSEDLQQVVVEKQNDIAECSFNVIPRKEEPRFKYSSVIRGKDKRDKLEGKACPQCEDYYSDLPLKERKEKLKEVCRHKSEYHPPSTPEGFWEIGIPDTQECKRRGYFKEATEHPAQSRPRARRKRPLLPGKFKKNN